MNTYGNFVERVKGTNEVSESKINEMHDDVANASSMDGDGGFVGVHLFVLVHGF